jgi:hypothetical protein
LGGDNSSSSYSKEKIDAVTEGYGVCKKNLEPSILKGVVFGGMEKEFSPLKMRSARKLGKEKENIGFTSLQVSEGPRALRA